MYYTYKRISKEVYEYCIENKIIDAALIAKWKKPGYERLCSTYVINPRNYKFATVSICRVPKQCLAPGTVIEDPMTGCRGCASGSGGEKNIFGNKYGQYLAAIQIAREERDNLRSGGQQYADDDQNNEENDEQEAEEQYTGPVGAADGSSGKKAAVWADEDEEIDLPESIMGVLSGDAEREGRIAAKNIGRGIVEQEFSGPPGKRSRT
jgi:bud site selection protein 31